MLSYFSKEKLCFFYGGISMVKKLTVIVLALILGMGSIISFTSRVSALDAGKIWLNDWIW